MAARPADDYYALLGIPADADLATLRRAWRQLARRWHPDHAGPEAKAMFQRLSAAYEVLADPVARSIYDLRRTVQQVTADVQQATDRAARPAAPPPGAATPAGAAPRAAAAESAAKPARRPAPGVLLTRVSRPLDILLAMGGARRALDDAIELFLDDEELAQGGMITIPMRVLVRCPTCGSRGITCPTCDSDGHVEELFSAWLAVPPGAREGTTLKPSVSLPGMLRPVVFRVRREHG